MAINWDLYNTRLNINGSTKRERDLYGVKSTLTSQLPDSLSCKSVTINGIARSIELVKDEKGYIKEIHSLPNETFDCGDYVVYNNKTYLVTEIDNDKEVYTSGKMQECTFVIKFQHPTTGTILSYPCITSGKSFSNDENRVITLPSNQKSVLLPYDENTKLLDTDKRLFVDRDNKKPYKIIGSPDNTTYNYGDKGLIYFVAQADVLQETDGEKPKDRPDLGICNYFEPTAEPEPTPSPSGNTLTIASSGDFNLGTIRTLTPTLKDDLGNTVSSWTAVWSVNYNGMTQTWFVVDDTIGNNKCSVEVLEDAYDVIDGVLELTCTVSGDTISATYSGMITA